MRKKYDQFAQEKTDSRFLFEELFHLQNIDAIRRLVDDGFLVCCVYHNCNVREQL